MLETIWFVLWTLLWAVYFVLDGFDLGMGTLLPFLGKTEEDRRIMYNAAGPFWDGQRSLADRGRRRDLCRLSQGIRGHVQRALRAPC